MMNKTTKNLLRLQYLWAAALTILVIVPALLYGSLANALPFLVVVAVIIVLKRKQIKKRATNPEKIYDERAKLIHFEAATYTMYGLFLLIFLFYGLELAQTGTISIRTNVELIGGITIWLLSGLYVNKKYK